MRKNTRSVKSQKGLEFPALTYHALKKAPWKNCAASFRNLDRILRNRKQRLIFTENACRFRFPHHIILLSLPVFLKYHTALTAYNTCFGCGALSCSFPSSSKILFTSTLIFSPFGFITSIVSPTENLFLCSIR